MTTLYGIDGVDPAEFIPFVGQGEAVFLGGVARARGVPDPIDIDALKSAFFDAYLAALRDPSISIGAPGARALVTACRAAGLKTAVASAADRVKAEANLRAAGFAVDLGVDFDAIVTADAFERLKPAPDIFLAAADALSTPPAHCVVIEDAPAGVAAARAAGMRVLGVCTTLTRAEMEGEAPDDVAADTSEVSVARLVGLRDTSV
jgi:HAD superfamily hydrolase (TIGR01509 family)